MLFCCLNIYTYVNNNSSYSNVFIGLYVCSTKTSSNFVEGMTSGSQKRCPNILMKGKELFLFNDKLAKVPGVNPIKFNNLEEYTEFVKWQRNQGIRCPVLFLQHSYDAQGESTYTARPSPFDLAGGLQKYQKVFQIH